jgi:cobalt-zinc-cadmium efflux system membrane fusion protein
MIQSRKSIQALVITGAIIAGGAAGFLAARVSAPTSEPAAAAKPEQPGKAPGTLAISPNDLAAAGIKTEAVRPGDLSTTVIAAAMVDAEIRGESLLMARVPGTVVQIAKRLGDPVKAGQTLAVVESRDAATLTAAREVAESRLKLARSVLAREQSLYEQMVTPRQDLERAQADVDAAEAEARRARATAEAVNVQPDGKTVAVISPMTGTVTSRTAELGQYVQAETELFRVSDPRFTDVDAAVTAADAQRIKPGDHAKVTMRSGKTAEAIVRSISPTVNEQTRTANVVLDPESGQPALTPGELVQVEITPHDAGSYGAVVPEEAIQDIDGRSAVFVRTQTGFAVRPVVVGAHSAGMTSITSGLNPGETIATTNAFLLKAELGKGAGEDQ